MGQDRKSLILRLYEAFNTAGQVCLKLNLPRLTFGRVWLCNLLEQPEHLLAERYGAEGVSFSYQPYQIITVKFELDRTG